MSRTIIVAIGSRAERDEKLVAWTLTHVCRRGDVVHWVHTDPEWREEDDGAIRNPQMLISDKATSIIQSCQAVVKNLRSAYSSHGVKGKISIEKTDKNRTIAQALAQVADARGAEILVVGSSRKEGLGKIATSMCDQQAYNGAIVIVSGLDQMVLERIMKPRQRLIAIGLPEGPTMETILAWSAGNFLKAGDMVTFMHVCPEGEEHDAEIRETVGAAWREELHHHPVRLAGEIINIFCNLGKGRASIPEDLKIQCKKTQPPPDVMIIGSNLKKTKFGFRVKAAQSTAIAKAVEVPVVLVRPDAKHAEHAHEGAHGCETTHHKQARRMSLGAGGPPPKVAPGKAAPQPTAVRRGSVDGGQRRGSVDGGQKRALFDKRGPVVVKPFTPDGDPQDDEHFAYDPQKHYVPPTPVKEMSEAEKKERAAAERAAGAGRKRDDVLCCQQ